MPALLLLTACAALFAQPPKKYAPLEGRMILCEDNSHFFSTRKPEEMTREDLRSWVDQYVGGAVTDLFLCISGQRANVPSDGAREPIWADMDHVQPKDTWPQNALCLFKAGIDPYTVWIERAREKSLGVWLSVRMNETYKSDEPAFFTHSSFCVLYSHLWRVSVVKKCEMSEWNDRALDYASATVRDSQMKFIDYLFDHYDFDGLDLDWMRDGAVFEKEFRPEIPERLDDFIRKIRAKADRLAEERTHPVRLSMRVPASPEAAKQMGLSVEKWADEGIIDLVIACPAGDRSDFGVDTAAWKKALEGTRTALAVSTRRDPLQPGDTGSASRTAPELL
ncbi:MAG: hypothetical protein J6S75_09610, partial [Thermoguttaceae bacterium]|nr:hypothetical protein [Thermoguttaceae bacterium]